MKLVCLNVWGGKLFDPLMEYVKKESAAADIFCFQEVLHAPGGEKEVPLGGRGDCFLALKEALPDYEVFYEPVINHWAFDKPVPYDLYFGQAIFVKKGIEIKEKGEVMIYREKDSYDGNPNTHPRNFVYTKIHAGGRDYMIMNIHGLLEQRGPKIDSPARVAQALKIKSFAEEAGCRVIICGDWNLLPNEPSLRMLEDAGFENLIRSFRIPTTRNDYYPGAKQYGDLLGDYLLASRDIDIKGFDVPNIDVSDHLPLVFEFD